MSVSISFRIQLGIMVLYLSGSSRISSKIYDHTNPGELAGFLAPVLFLFYRWVLCSSRQLLVATKTRAPLLLFKGYFTMLVTAAVHTHQR